MQYWIRILCLVMLNFLINIINNTKKAQSNQIYVPLSFVLKMIFFNLYLMEQEYGH